MLPYINNDRNEGSASKPVDSIKREHDEGHEFDVLETAAEDLCNAIAKKDYKAMAEALRAAFELCDSEPHEEGPHE